MTPKSLVESMLDEEKPIVLRDRVIPNGDMFCPHCQNLIHEKGTFYRDGKHIHGACGGVIKFPPPSPEEQAWLKRFQGIGEEKEPGLDVLKKHEVKLTPEELKIVFERGAVWNMNGDPKPTSGVHKAVVGEKTWYFCYTHRAYRVKPTLVGAINEFDWVESTS
jgi:hypothetical protein